jgi:alpha-L-fucosidase
MKRRTLLHGGLATLASFYLPKLYANSPVLRLQGKDALLSGQSGPFLPTWDSLAQYQVPSWFRDAKFGIWAHWGPQCQPERGDWYARGMYQEGSDQYTFHCQKYGHPSRFGFKDVIQEWKAEAWAPDDLLAFYKQSGARYFMALACHHDNFDLFDSRYQSWNATKMGPQKDLIGGWAKAARKEGLPFGVSVHASHAWTWYEPSQRADKAGPLMGVPYDGKLRSVDGAGKWWNGLDPQELYAQNHPISVGSLDDGAMGKYWDWGNGAYPPSGAYCDKFYKRVINLIDAYDPDMVYFDDTALPLYPVSDVGLHIAAHLYNKSVQKNGQMHAVLFGKVLNEQQQKCMVWDIERGQSNTIEPLAWQTDTCIGDWHYDRRLYDNDGYKTATTVIHMLCDIVSKNGNLLLNIPLRGNGMPDEKERMVVEGVGAWMRLNGEAIYESRPWKIYGEGPASEAADPVHTKGFNEGKGKPFTAQDIRFTTRQGVLYAIMLGWPVDQSVLIHSFPEEMAKAGNVTLLGSETPLPFTHSGQGLRITLPNQPTGKDAYVLRIEGVLS